MVEPAQIRAARALLGMNQRELSKLAEVAISTVKRIETSVEMTGSVRTLWKLQSALEQAGVEFIPGDDSKGAGVRLKRARPGSKSQNRSKRPRR
jgi:transcriptional regulator with XRE-family HTH domain